MSDGFRFIEGWEGDTSALVWQSQEMTLHTDYGRFGKGAGTATYNKSSLSPVLGDQMTAMIVGFAFRWQPPISGGVGAHDLLMFAGPNSVQTVVLELTAQRTLAVRSGSSGTTYRQYSTFSLDQDAWYYIEMYATRHGTNGRIIVQVNGSEGTPGSTAAEVIDVSGIDTGTTTAAVTGYNQFEIGHIGGNGATSIIMSFDDIYARNAADGGFVGDSSVYLIDLEDDRAVEFTRSSGAKNYLMVNEATPDDDTTYNQADTSGYEDVFEVADQTFPGSFIHCVQLVARSRKTETEAWTMQTLIDLNGTVSYAGERYLPYHEYETRPPDVYGDAPGLTGWTLQNINDMGVGYRVDRDGAVS